MVWSVTQMYPVTIDAPANARRYCAAQLASALGGATGSREVAMSDLAATAQLIVSELVTNSINAGSTHVGLRLSIENSCLRLAVRDDAPGQPALGTPEPGAPRGRGLTIVDRLADAWGTAEIADGKQVWAEVELPPNLRIAPVAG